MKQKKALLHYKPHPHAHLVRCDLSKYESHHHPHYRSFDIQFLFSCILQNINKIPLLLSSKYGIYILSDSYFTIYSPLSPEAAPAKSHSGTSHLPSH